MLALKSITNSDLLTFDKIEMWKVKEYYYACWTAKKDELWWNQTNVVLAQ